MSQELDLALLQQYFHISKEGADNTLFSYPAEQLVEPEVINHILRVSQEGFRSNGMELPASFVANAFFGWAAVQLLFMSKYNLTVNLSLSCFDFQAEPRPGHIHSAFRWHRMEYQDIPEERPESYLREQFSLFYQETLHPVLEQTALSAGLKPELLWNQYAGRMRYIYDYLLRNEPSEAARRRLELDYALLCSMPSEDFRRPRNPFVFTPRYVDNPWKPEEPMLIRSSCCMYYKRENGELCYNCPKLTPEQRNERKKEIELKLASS